MPIPLLLHGRHADAQITYRPFHDWIVPWRFCSFEDEYHSLRTGAGLIDYSTHALIQVRGEDRATFLHSLLTNDVLRLTPGTGCRAALLNASAKLLADLLVFTEPDCLWLLCPLTRVDLVVQTLERHHFSERVEFTNHERRFAVIAMQGPRTFEVLARLFGQAISLHHLGDHVIAALDDLSVRLIHYSLINDSGALCLIDSEQVSTIWEFLRHRREHFGLELVGWEAFNTARIEAGVPLWGIDMDESNLLSETGLEATTVSESKGCYLGQEIVARLQTYGSISQKLVGLTITGEQVPGQGATIMRDADCVGRITSACYSPTLRRPIAMGYVKRSAYEVGTRVEILTGEHRLPAQVTARPFLPTSSPNASTD